MIPGEVVRLKWVTSHPAGTMIFREDTVIIRAVGDGCVTFEFVDGFATVRVELAKVLGYEPAELAR